MSTHSQPISPHQVPLAHQVRELVNSYAPQHATEAQHGHSAQQQAARDKTKPPVEKQHYELSHDLIEKAIDDANQLVRNSESQLQFSLHQGDNMVTVRLTDVAGGGVVREIPSHHFLTMLEALRKLSCMNVDVTR